MKNIAIICEYNPMHNGHIHQIKTIKKEYPESNIIILMSGSFVQRGEPSILDKFKKANIAIENGVDLVLEMPAIISLQSANYFSYYSVKILDKLKNIDFISFGIENEPSEFAETFNLLNQNKEKINLIQKKYIEQGNSFKKSYSMALKELKLQTLEDIILKPNNTLAFQYLNATSSLKSKIKPLMIKRIDGGYHSSTLDEYEFQSATTIRQMIFDNKDIRKYVPHSTNQLINDIVRLDDFSQLFIYKAKILGMDAQNIAGYENGILNLLINNFEENLTKTVEKSHNKRYSKSRLKRFIINYLLNITNKDIKLLDDITYIRPLSFNENGRNIINELKSNKEIDLVMKISNVKELNEQNKRLLEIDKMAYQLRNINFTEKYSLDYTNKPYIKNTLFE
ncbi:tRNA(Met) cytidine acetate ligase [Helcococcus kunzii]|uniref:tRNA(Met) cytidine acetate ligase n=1 Tax=Helcococcus kunzii TaxID=40091 RepID=UPI001BAF6C8F|nr:nucleotidyltransferase family protein [Helcococcus kunzii]MCT1795557.1 nucleotidyltransferase family protein [Helcococcus kunzii]MCT1989335.1 nucleotidyltransferase family protein [Helcococcus kunzii]QUY64800.1 nucleotidyltransferase family protein [Helcococcus kunzii]